ncbi:MAG: aminomethyl-transferring glycine dehydrogenase subunit GcvPA [Chloroflexi bacterium]|nr:MAG: aminomethyl-transferring glycine dehydrogenase subunit GcvPA [Chloroflexota bacterium]
MAYLPHTDADRRSMLAAVGAGSVEDLFASVPRALLDPALELPAPLGEQDLVAELEGLAARNRPLSGWHSFLGAGVYHRFIPAIVRATVSRPEFYTAYTPYQAEASQGTLQSIFEFQSMICALTALDVANASLYDGATATAEAALLAVAHTGRTRVAVSAGLHPETLQVLDTYRRGRGVTIDRIPLGDGLTLERAARAVLGKQHAALVVAQPNFLGAIESLEPLAEAAHAAGALAVAAVDPIACAALAPPGDAGFDVAVGDGQPLGLPPSFGGPHVGFMALRQELLRRLPGRLVGMTRDAAGERAYTLTLQTREQHIRREAATSNICTNHALMALAATVYMARMGGAGMRAVAELSAQRAHHLAGRLTELPGVALAHPEAPFLWEFALRIAGNVEQLVAGLRRRGILAGLALGRFDPDRDDQLLVCCTEMTPPAAIDAYVDAMRALVTHPEEVRA